MPGIFPPTGVQDRERALSVGEKEREYMWFCLEFCDHVLGRRPTHLEALELAAARYTELGYYADGLRLDLRLADIKPGDASILYNLSCSLALVGRRDDALLTLARAVKNGYADSRHMATDRDLASLRDDERFMLLLKDAGERSAAENTPPA